MQWSVEVELLAQELKSLVGYGAKPHHVLARPTLRGLFEDPEFDDRALAQKTIFGIVQATERLGDPLGLAFRWLLRLNNDSNAETRRWKFIRLMNLNISEAAFRRHESPEMHYCRVLAGELLKRDG